MVLCIDRVVSTFSEETETLSSSRRKRCGRYKSGISPHPLHLQVLQVSHRLHSANYEFYWGLTGFDNLVDAIGLYGTILQWSCLLNRLYRLTDIIIRQTDRFTNITPTSTDNSCCKCFSSTYAILQLWLCNTLKTPPKVLTKLPFSSPSAVPPQSLRKNYRLQICVQQESINQDKWTVYLGWQSENKITTFDFITVGRRWNTSCWPVSFFLLPPFRRRNYVKHVYLTPS